MSYREVILKQVIDKTFIFHEFGAIIEGTVVPEKSILFVKDYSLDTNIVTLFIYTFLNLYKSGYLMEEKWRKT